MVRPCRRDTPGSWHHVINRGLAKRPLFEDRVDVRYFLSRLAREVRRGSMEIHAWCILTTHFHLLVYCPQGELSQPLRRAQNAYVRFFNRRHRRDGTLVRGRFFSKPVESIVYRRRVVSYIDDNSIQAGLARHPWDYPWCSAASYVHRQGPIWLERSWVEQDVAQECGDSFTPGAYAKVFGAGLGESARALMASYENGAGPLLEPLDDLVRSAPPRVLDWMQRKAKLADGGMVGVPVCDVDSVREAIREARARSSPWTVRPVRIERDGFELLEPGLLRTLAGQTWNQIAIRLDMPMSTARRNVDLHRALIDQDAGYALVASEVSTRALGRCWA